MGSSEILALGVRLRPFQGVAWSRSFVELAWRSWGNDFRNVCRKDVDVEEDAEELDGENNAAHIAILGGSDDP